MLEVIDASGGEVKTVSEQEIIVAIKELAQTEGLLLSPEGAAAWKAIEHLAKSKKISAHERALFLNTAIAPAADAPSSPSFGRAMEIARRS